MVLRFSIIACVLAAALHGQWTGSGSSGSDGALNLTTPGTVVFEPQAFDPPLKPARGNIYNFTTIYIGKGVTVKLSALKLVGPIFWLAQGPVVIEGSIDLNGDDSSGPVPSAPGSGGYPGGAAGKPGYRPASFVSNSFLVPLAGGFGGDGGLSQGGGGGGGAVLIASSASIMVNGVISANGGSSAGGTGGNGGAIRLAAPTIGGQGKLTANGGQPGGAQGLVRFEATQNQFTGDLNNTPSVRGKPFGVFLPPQQASVRIVSVDAAGIARPANERLTEIIVEARYVPPGTSVELEVFSKDGSSQSVMTSPLAGTFELSRASASFTPPRDAAGGIVSAEWKQPKSEDLSK